jgi:hypothetical protein
MADGTCPSLLMQCLAYEAFLVNLEDTIIIGQMFQEQSDKLCKMFQKF